MGIARKGLVSECSWKIRSMAEVYHGTDYYANKCLETGNRVLCETALGQLKWLEVLLAELIKAGCIRDADDFLEEVRSTKTTIERLLASK